MSKLEQLINELCPEGVEYKELGKIVKISNGKDHKHLADEEIPVYGSGGVMRYANQCIYDKVSVLIPRKGSIGNIFYIDTPFWTVDTIFYTKINLNLINARFLYHYLLTQNIEKLNTAGGIPSLTKTVLDRIQIPLPPIPVQEEIVRILDKFTKLTAELTMKLTARKQQYEYYSELLLNFKEEYDCKKNKLKEICDIYLGLTATPKYTNSGVKFISAQNTSKDFLDLENVKYISEIDYAKATSNAKPKRGDILFTRVGSNLGHPVIVDTDEKLCIFVSLGFLRIKNKNIVSNSYLKHWMNTDLFWSQVRKKVFGAAKVNLNTGWLKEFELTLPPINIQEKIVNHLDCFEKYFNFLHDDLFLEIEVRQKTMQRKTPQKRKRLLIALNSQAIGRMRKTVPFRTL